MTPTQPTPDAASLPWPGEELAHRVTGGTDPVHFYRTGRASVEDLEAVLGLARRHLADYPTILDFGTGCGRIMLWLEHLSATCSLHGVDIDERAIRWSRDNMPWATFKVNGPRPPLDYPDAYFDLVFNHSVFTHIDEEYQDLWLAELRRVVKPGGHLVLSVHGEAAFQVVEQDMVRSGVGDPRPVRAELSTRGISFTRDDVFTGGPFPDFYHSTFHAPWYVFQHWGRYFTIAGYVPRGSMGFQDFVLLERPLPGADAPEPITVAPGARQPAGLPGRPPHPGHADGVPGGLGGVDGSALSRADDLLRQGYDPARGEEGPRAAARLVVERALRSYTHYERQVDQALFAAIHELKADLDRRTTGGEGRPIAELTARLWDAVRLQGERVNRLEADLWAAIRARPAGDAPSPTATRSPG